jgi:two-component system, chemotaxis family, CheB/CheR fusion protein
MNTSGLLVVGIGASAGGVQACREFFQHVPADSGAAYVVILHLSPEYESELAGVLQRSARIAVTQVSERTRVEPNHVYVVPPNHVLSMEDGFVAPLLRTRVEERRAPVDIFFRTLAESHHAKAVSVVLSGTGANGSMGLKRVKELGGICLAQDPNEAEFDDMPRHAIATGLVDDVLPVAALPKRIVAYRDTRESVRIPQEPASGEANAERALREIFGIVRVKTGHDFSNYKRATVLRRIERRMSVHQQHEITDYARYVRDKPEEALALLKDLLISVTHFFRDAEAFEALEHRVIPKLFEEKGEEDQVRVWVAGCATGEEAYSIAMLLVEHVTAGPGAPLVQVFATDIDEGAVATAREGLYTLNDAADVSPERLRRFFTKEGNYYRIRKELREMVLFAHHNLLKDPPFSHLDLISCRNLLIYLNRAAQKRVMEVMHFALNPGRFLFLGTSESIEGSGDLFVAMHKDAHIFQSRGVVGRFGVPIPDITLAARQNRARDERPALARTRERLSAADLHQRVLEQYAAPSVVVNEEHEIIHLSARAGRFLEYAGGEPSTNLLKAIRAELRLELRTALYQAAQQGTAVAAEGLVVHIDGRASKVDLTVRPVLRDGDTARGFFLVLFQEADGTEALQESATTSAVSSGDAARQLEDELIRLKAQLRLTVERHETQAEELKASNEELQAMNEELRSSAEELETSKEELQSVNEELRTVNQELKLKIEEQTQAADDIQNLINSTEIGTIFLDRTLRIQFFTPRARDIFNLIPADKGRPLSDISSRLVDPDLHLDVERVLSTLQLGEREVRTQDGHWFMMRLAPYRTANDRIDGVVMTFVDVNKRRQAEEALRVGEARLRSIVESVAHHAIITLDRDGRIEGWNSSAEQMFGFSAEEAIGQSSALIFTEEDRANGEPFKELEGARQTGRALDERWHVRKDGSRIFTSGVLSPVDDPQMTGFVKVARDLTERKQWEDQLQRAYSELEARVAERTHQLGALNATLGQELSERKEAEDRVRRLLSRIITVQEEERRHIARDLHDHLGQQMTGLHLKLESLRRKPGDQAEWEKAFKELQTFVLQIDRDLDFFTWELRPAGLYDLGLSSALRDYVDAWSRNFTISAEFSDIRLPARRFTTEIEVNLYRIAQEALNNVHKHANATRADVQLRMRDHHIVLTVEDNGIGFDVDDSPKRGPLSIGLVGMRERAVLLNGQLEVESMPGRGTTVIATVPAMFAATPEA